MGDAMSFQSSVDLLGRLGVPGSRIGEVELAGRDSDLFLFVEDEGTTLCIEIGDDASFGVPIAWKQLEEVLSYGGGQFHHLQVDKLDHRVEIESHFWEAIQTGLPNVRVLEIQFLWEHSWSPEELDSLLNSLPSGLEKLKLWSCFCVFPAALQQIPLLFPHLKKLEFDSLGFSAFQNLDGWSTLLEQLNSLETLEVHRSVSTVESWGSLAWAIQTHPNLKTVRFSNIRQLCDAMPFEDEGIEFKFDRETEDAILCRLGINKATATLEATGGRGGPTLEQWVDLLVDSRHDIGCLDHLLSSSVDPTSFARAAIEGLSGPAYQRMLDQAAEKTSEQRSQERKQERRLTRLARAEAFRYIKREEEDDSDEGDTDGEEDGGYLAQAVGWIGGFFALA